MEAQPDDWPTTIADVRIHGTTHVRPIDRFLGEERVTLLPIAGHGGYAGNVPVSRIAADGHLVSFQSNRYWVPLRLIGKTVELIPAGATLRVEHAE